MPWPVVIWWCALFAQWSVLALARSRLTPAPFPCRRVVVCARPPPTGLPQTRTAYQGSAAPLRRTSALPYHSRAHGCFSKPRACASQISQIGQQSVRLSQPKESPLVAPLRRYTVHSTCTSTVISLPVSVEKDPLDEMPLESPTRLVAATAPYTSSGAAQPRRARCLLRPVSWCNLPRERRAPK